MEVQKILNSWRSPAGKHFQISTPDHSIFTLTYLEADDQWSIEYTGSATDFNVNKESI